LCAGHLFDIAIVTPAFRDGQLVGLMGTVGHVSDIGGTKVTTDNAGTAAFTDLGIEVGASIAEGIWQGIWRSIQRRIESGTAWTLLLPAVAIAVLAAMAIARRRSTRRGLHRRKGGKST
jgi:hypothetical protein